MILREFSLSLPYIKNESYISELINTGLSRSDAIRQDYSDNWKWKNFNFGLENRCICSMFERLFLPIKTEFWKIQVECVPGEPREKILVVGGGCEVQVSLNFEEYTLLDPLSKKKLALDLLYQGIERVCKKYNLDINMFKEIKDKIIESNYTNHWYLGKPKKNTNRKYSAQIYLEHEPDVIDIYMVLSNKTEMIGKKLLTSEIPHEYKWVPLLGRLKWIDNENVILKSRDKKITFSVNVNELG